MEGDNKKAKTTESIIELRMILMLLSGIAFLAVSTRGFWLAYTNNNSESWIGYTICIVSAIAAYAFFKEA